MIGVLHFSFTVSDIDKSVRWYTDVLGLELVNRQRQNNQFSGNINYSQERGPQLGLQYRREFEPGGGLNSLFRMK